MTQIGERKHNVNEKIIHIFYKRMKLTYLQTPYSNRLKELSSNLSDEAIHTAKETNFETARFSWDAIPDEKIRKNVSAEIFEICIKFGDREALECLIKIGKMEKDLLKRNYFLFHLIDACQKLQDKVVVENISTLALSEITDDYSKRQYKKKLGLL